MECICDNAMQLAAYIEENYKDITVNYAGLETSNWHEIAKSQFDGHYGVFDDLVRVSVGIEDIDDLIWDFKQAIESLS